VPAGRHRLGGAHLASEARTGYIDRGAKSEGEVCGTHADDEPAVIRIVRDSTGLA